MEFPQWLNFEWDCFVVRFTHSLLAMTEFPLRIPQNSSLRGEAKQSRSKFHLKFRHCGNSVIGGGILNFSGVLGAAAPKGLGRSPYKICELG